jgi:prepilin-type N-terminal cleavage/methylation domain-containing protein
MQRDLSRDDLVPALMPPSIVNADIRWPRADRRGFSLAELVAVVALAGIMGSAVAMTINRQQLFYRDASELHYAREGVREAMEVMSTDIRAMSVSDTVRLRADSAIEFFAGIGSSVVCQSAGGQIGLPARHTEANSLSAFLVEPDTGDIAAFHTRSAEGSEEWERHRISGFSSRSLANSCPTSSGFSAQADLDAGMTGFVVTLADPLSDGIKPGAPVRFLRRARYSLYRASNGHWYLGYRRCNAVGASTCGPVQPLSGPYRAYSADARVTGLEFEYFDTNGQSLGASDSPLMLARVDITARSEGLQRIATSGQAGGTSESATISVAVRNRVR